MSRPTSTGSHRKATLSDVARAAGVSATTASYILNGRGGQMRISAETEERVRAAATALAYRPNRSARSLRTRRTATLGVISDLVAGGHFASGMLTGASRAARELDHLLVIGESGGDPELERLLLEEMLSRDVDGVVYATVRASGVRLPTELLGVRTVTLNCVDPGAGVAAVLPDDVAGGRLAAAALADAGVRDIWVVGHDPQPVSTAGRDRLAGITVELGSRGLRVQGRIECPWLVRESYDAVHAWLATRDGPPGGLICLNDRVGMGVYEALEEHGLRIPDQVSVVSFGGSELAHWLRPALTSVALPFQELGATAVRRLLAAEPPDSTITWLPLAVRPGASIAAAGSAALL